MRSLRLRPTHRRLTPHLASQATPRSTPAAAHAPGASAPPSPPPSLPHLRLPPQPHSPAAAPTPGAELLALVMGWGAETAANNSPSARSARSAHSMASSLHLLSSLAHAHHHHHHHHQSPRADPLPPLPAPHHQQQQHAPTAMARAHAAALGARPAAPLPAPHHPSTPPGSARPHDQRLSPQHHHPFGSTQKQLQALAFRLAAAAHDPQRAAAALAPLLQLLPASPAASASSRHTPLRATSGSVINRRAETAVGPRDSGLEGALRRLQREEDGWEGQSAGEEDESEEGGVCTVRSSGALSLVSVGAGTAIKLLLSTHTPGLAGAARLQLASPRSPSGVVVWGEREGEEEEEAAAEAIRQLFGPAPEQSGVGAEGAEGVEEAAGGDLELGAATVATAAPTAAAAPAPEAASAAHAAAPQPEDAQDEEEGEEQEEELPTRQLLAAFEAQAPAEQPPSAGEQARPHGATALQQQQQHQPASIGGTGAAAPPLRSPMAAIPTGLVAQRLQALASTQPPLMASLASEQQHPAPHPAAPSLSDGEHSVAATRLLLCA